MDVYSLQRVARMEYEQRVRSLPPVPEFGAANVQRSDHNPARLQVSWMRPLLIGILHMFVK